MLILDKKKRLEHFFHLQSLTNCKFTEKNNERFPRKSMKNGCMNFGYGVFGQKYDFHQKKIFGIKNRPIPLRYIQNLLNFQNMEKCQLTGIGKFFFATSGILRHGIFFLPEIYMLQWKC